MVSYKGLVTIYFESRASGCSMCRESWETKKEPNLGFFIIGVSKYVTNNVIWVLLFIIYALHHYGIIQRPHDHLFQNSCIWVQNVPRKLRNEKTQNSGFFINGVSTCDTNQVILVLLFIIYVLHHNGITQRPHDHLF